MDKSSGGAVTRTVTYYPVAGAMRINSTLYYVLKDHLGSASVVTDASGNTVGEQRYYPYGETRWTSGTIFTDKLYTGQREMTGLGIYHYQARFYSPKLGRFLSADTIVPGMYNPQALNRYSYVLGNPLRYTDPTGHMQWEDTYEENDGVCDPGDASCNWLGGGNKPNPSGGGGGNNNGVNPGSDPISDYCGDSSDLACAATLSQDVATLIDLVGVGLIEAPYTIMGCLDGGLLGCALGEFAAWGVWNTTLNNVETAASGVSLVFTVLDDAINNGGLGENTATSLTTFLAGLIPLTPSWDLVVDTYSSGYNHGFFNGVYTLGSNGLFKP